MRECGSGGHLAGLAQILRATHVAMPIKNPSIEIKRKKKKEVWVGVNAINNVQNEQEVI